MFSNWNLRGMRRLFVCTKTRTISWIRQKTKNFPIVNIAHFANVMSMGKYLFFCQIKLKFRFWVHKQRWHTSSKFQLEIRSNKIIIAKQPLTNGNEMNDKSSKLPAPFLSAWRSYVTTAPDAVRVRNANLENTTNAMYRRPCRPRFDLSTVLV